MSSNLKSVVWSEDRSYLTGIESEPVHFYLSALSNSNRFDLMLGYFSSAAISILSLGFASFLCNGGKVRIIINDVLSYSDREAISKGQKNDISCNAFDIHNIKEMKNILDEYSTHFFECIAWLISNKLIDIIIIRPKEKKGIAHYKSGIFYDDYNNAVGFKASCNFTAYGLLENLEELDAYLSWENGRSQKLIKNNNEYFEKIFNREAEFVEYIDIDEVQIAICNEFGNKQLDELVIHEKELIKKKQVLYNNEKFNSLVSDIMVKYEMLLKEPKIPFGLEFYDYQKDAVAQWALQEYVGIYDMATGTGKTYTGLMSVVELFNYCEGELAVVIVCPYQHLVEQWAEDLDFFNIKPIIGFSNSPQPDWRKRLEMAIRDFKLNNKKRKFFCFICTNATFGSDFVQTQISKIKGNSFILIDEAHNFGAERLSAMLPYHFKYRLALSATLDRHNDDEGTAKLYKFFGRKCIEYSIERAIKEKKLTPYKYYPILVHLNEIELELYSQLSYEIGKCLISDKKGKLKLNKYGELLALKRARIIAAASGKISMLHEKILPYKEQNSILVYCGAASLIDENSDNTDLDEGDLRQIDAVTDLLGNRLNMKVAQFTSREDVVKRSIRKKEFEKGINLQALIAIKCLDEGVNIPRIKTVFILASTTNPKEYIQRRGRVLRLAKDKDFAEIYDFITLPRQLNEVASLTIEEMKRDLTLIKNELNRAQEFSRIALNSMIADKVIQEVKEVYGLNCQPIDFNCEYQ